MKLREKIKRFWTLDVHNHEGFTLVELIIVIAILAILSSVAVVGYGSYVTKANKQTDMTLISEVIRAAELYAYSKNIGSASNPAGDVAGYVVITNAGALAGGPFAEEAMAAAFGTNFGSNKLKWSGWTNAWSTLNNVEASIAGSSYVNVGTNALLGDVQHCTSSLAAVLSNHVTGMAGAELLDGFLGGNYVSEYVKGMKEEDITEEVLANAVVFALAAQMSDSSSDTAEEVKTNMGNGYYILRNWSDRPAGEIVGIPPYDDQDTLLANFDSETLLTETAATYAALEAFCAYMDYPFELEFTGDTRMVILEQLVDACNDVMKYAMDTAYPERNAKAVQYLGGQASTDANAFLSIMGSVNDLNGEFKDQLGDAELFAGQDMLNRVNGYMAVSAMKPEYKTDIQDAVSAAEFAVVILFTRNADGSFGCTVFEPGADPRN